MEKKFIKDEQEWLEFIKQFHYCDGFNTHVKPDHYPCVIVWQTFDVKNQSCDGCYQDFVYLDDFNKTNKQKMWWENYW
jgi:hypothetical protein